MAGINGGGDLMQQSLKNTEKSSSKQQQDKENRGHKHRLSADLSIVNLNFEEVL